LLLAILIVGVVVLFSVVSELMRMGFQLLGYEVRRLARVSDLEGKVGV